MIMPSSGPSLSATPLPSQTATQIIQHQYSGIWLDIRPQYSGVWLDIQAQHSELETWFTEVTEGFRGVPPPLPPPMSRPGAVRSLNMDNQQAKFPPPRSPSLERAANLVVKESLHRPIVHCSH